MVRVARYADEVMAHAAVHFLRQSGVPAVLVGDRLAEAINARGASFIALDVMVPSEAHRAHAEALLHEFDSEPMTLEEGWEERIEPDLSRLARGVALTCKWCGTALPMVESITTCGSCGSECDVVQEILARYGPEALAQCYGDEDGAGDTDAEPQPLGAERAPRMPPGGRIPQASCAQCGAFLDSGSARGRCAACGSLYDLDSAGGRRR